MTEDDDWQSRPLNSTEIETVKARTRELLESLGLEAFFMAVASSGPAWMKDRSAEDRLEDLLAKARQAPRAGGHL